MKAEAKQKILETGLFTTRAVLIVIVLGLLAYSNTFQATFHLDDHFGITENPSIRNITNIRYIWRSFNTRFIAGVSFSLNYFFGKLDVFGYHLFNLTCHILSSTLVFFLVLFTFRTPALKNKVSESRIRLICLFSALIFLTHPLQTQAVTYIWQRITSLAALFYLAAVTFYVKARLARKVVSYGLALAATILAMLTKEITVTIPVMLMLYEGIFFVPKKEGWKKTLILLTPFLATIFIIPLMLLRISPVTMDLSRSALISSEQKASEGLIKGVDVTRGATTASLSRKDHLCTQINVVRTYLRLLFYPVNQNLDYDYPLSSSLSEPKTLFSAFAVLLILFSAIKILKRHRLISFGIFWFFLALSIETIIPIYDLIFEHRLYLPMAGFGIFLSCILSALLKKDKEFVMLMAVIILGLSIATYRRNSLWRDETTLWSDVVKKSPGKARPHRELGFAYLKEGGDYIKGIEHLEKAIRIRPNDYRLYNSLGILYAMAGKEDKMIDSCSKAIEIYPGYCPALENLGIAYYEKGDHKQAMELFNKAAKIDPRNYKVYDNLANLYIDRTDLARAEEYLNRALEVNPNFAEYCHERALLYRKQYRRDKLKQQMTKLRLLRRRDLLQSLERF